MSIPQMPKNRTFAYNFVKKQKIKSNLLKILPNSYIIEREKIAP